MAAGDHLAVARKWFFWPYYHHGIDVGDGKVVHLTGPRKKDCKVVETSLAEFLQGGTKEIVDYIRFIDILINYKLEFAALVPKSEAHLRRDHWMLPFLDDDRVDEIRKRIEDPQRAVTEARKNLNKRGYNFFADNCEHFAVFCKTGLSVSHQSIEHQKVFDLIHSRVGEIRSNGLGPGL